MNRYQEYYQANRERILAQKKEYRRRPEAVATRRKYERSVLPKRSKYVSKRAMQRREQVNAIAVAYGCRNPDCPWKAPYDSCLLTFHHFDPTAKLKGVSAMMGYPKAKIAAEINKCIVLCVNCHSRVHAGLLECTENMLCCVNEELQFPQGLK